MSRQAIKLIVKRHVQALMAGVPSKGHALLMGPTGSGKTYTIKEELSKVGDIPVITIDATSLTREGWSGLTLQGVLDSAYEQYGDQLESAIIYVDEFDKLNKAGDNQGHSKGVQYNFLPYLDGTEMMVKRDRKPTVTLSTSNMTFVFSGAFTEFWEDTKQSIGFNPDAAGGKGKNLHESLVKSGFVKELTYRIPYIIKVDPYTREELKAVIKSHFGYRQMKLLFNVNVDLEKMLDFIEKHPAGARAIQLYLSKVDLEQFQEARTTTTQELTIYNGDSTQGPITK